MLEEVARYLETNSLSLEVWKTDREAPDQETLLETQLIDLSFLLFNKQKDSSETWVFDKM